jgi:hypothetical protein
MVVEQRISHQMRAILTVNYNWQSLLQQLGSFTPERKVRMWR